MRKGQLVQRDKVMGLREEFLMVSLSVITQTNIVIEMLEVNYCSLFL